MAFSKVTILVRMFVQMYTVHDMLKTLFNSKKGNTPNVKYSVTFIAVVAKIALYSCHRNNTAVLFGVDLFETNSNVSRFVFPPEDNNTRSYIVVDAADMRRPRSVGMMLDPEPATSLFPPSRQK